MKINKKIKTVVTMVVKGTITFKFYFKILIFFFLVTNKLQARENADPVSFASPISVNYWHLYSISLRSKTEIMLYYTPIFSPYFVLHRTILIFFRDQLFITCYMLIIRDTKANNARTPLSNSL